MSHHRSDADSERAQSTPLTAGEMCAFLAPLAAYRHITLAVSGGPDSLALLLAMACWRDQTSAQPHNLPPVDVVTFDHGLRAASKREADSVAAIAKSYGFTHRTLTWSAEKPTRAIAATARAARYEALADHAATCGGAGGRVAVVTGHHLDDQAETVLMRLARGTGIEGLAAMRATRPLDAPRDVWLVRPFLSVSKARLAATVTAAGLDAVDDPTNRDPAFERPRWRARQSGLAAFGLSASALARTARRAGEAVEALDYALEAAARSCVLDYRPGVAATLNWQATAELPDFLRARLVAKMISAFGGATASPSLSEIELLSASIADLDFSGATLGGAMMTIGAAAAGRASLIVCREAGRLADTTRIAPGETLVWDRRYRISVSDNLSSGAVIRPLSAVSAAVLADCCPTLNPAFTAARRAYPVVLIDDRLHLCFNPESMPAQVVDMATSGPAGASAIAPIADSWLLAVRSGKKSSINDDQSGPKSEC